MNRRYPKRLRTLCILSAYFCLVLGCGNSAVDEQRAKDIVEKAEQLRTSGRPIEALQEFARLVDFRGTAVFKKAEAALMEEGISIEDPLESWTLKRMIEAQNTLVGQGKDWHRDGEITIPYSAQDAWGRSLLIQYSRGDKYSFVVISAGKDRQLGTDDDLKIYNRNKPGEGGKRTQNGEKSKTQSLESLSRGTISRTRGTTPSENGNNRETVVRLKDLLGN